MDRGYDDEVVQPDGEPGVYGVVHPKFLAVGVVALDDDGSVLMVGQHRYTLDLFTWGIPGGGVPFDEDALDGAKRELQEETGVTATTWHELATSSLSNSITDGRGMVFLATGLSNGVPQRDGTESAWRSAGCRWMKRSGWSTQARSTTCSRRSGCWRPTVPSGDLGSVDQS